MYYLLLSIVASTAVLVIFKLMQRSDANTRHAIMLSYAVSAVFGLIAFTPQTNIVVAPWFLPAALEGMAFYVVFQAMARTAQRNGVAVASIAAKMSVVIPILIGLLFLGEDASAMIVAGVLLGLGSIAMSAGSNVAIGDWKWPVFVFVGTGLIDASFKLFQIWGLSTGEFPGFVATVFLFAFMTGLIHHVRNQEKAINSHSIFAGLLLGLANFGTVYFLLNALATPDMESSVIYALNNFGIVGLSTVIAVAFFKEKLNTRGWIGLVLASLSIVMIYRGSV